MTISITPFEAPTYLHLELDSFVEELDYFGFVFWAYIFIDGTNDDTVRESSAKLLEQLDDPRGLDELAFQTLIWEHGLCANGGYPCPSYTAYDARAWIMRKRGSLEALLGFLIDNPNGFHYEYIEDLI